MYILPPTAAKTKWFVQDLDTPEILLKSSHSPKRIIDMHMYRVYTSIDQVYIKQKKDTTVNSLLTQKNT